ncbi:CPBP family intramembrane glutamic endopeptidase [Jannaschia pohangensis]|uniref:CAAX prenyl protease 2/Lysostaphin resistance protein A-like domain-containing protein n=1 Tax=Jannaschia pohangensis TaxID=390807 RepID=A0A1I3U791_9RHOB|nr:CPBP family intramembrane glutamic endopeptidase [Jannaschia pohangensis]SFJ77641.1 hypothetical protein SAMN04488095_3615 [Jannaschia pohangensis]
MIPHLRTRAFEVFIASARTYPQVWRVILGFLLVEAAFNLGGLFTVLTIMEFEAPPLDGRWTIGTTPLGVIVILASFISLVAGTALVARLLHDRPLSSLLGPEPLLCFIPIFGLTLASMALMELLLFDTDGIAAHRPLALVLAWTPLILPALLLQTGAEELFYRGYLQSQLAARFQSPVVWMGAPSLLFAAAHVDLLHLLEFGTWADNDGLWFVSILLSGLFAADLTRVTGSIGPAWAWHFANNLYAMFIVSMAGDLTGLSLYLLPFAPWDPVFGWTDLAMILLSQITLWALLRLWLARRGYPE